MGRFRLSIFAAAAIALLGAGPVLADIFSFKDERGVVHFTNMPSGDKRFKLVRKEEGSSPTGAPVLGSPRVAQLFMPAAADILRYSNIIETASKTHGVDANLVHAVISAESGYNAAALS